MEITKEREDHAVCRDIAYEMEEQDNKHGGYSADRDGVRLGIAAAEDELREALAAWDSEKRPLTVGDGKQDPVALVWKWTKTRRELMQVAGVIARTIREIDRAARERDGV